MDKYNPADLEGWDDFWHAMTEQRKQDFDNLLQSLATDIGKGYEPTVADFKAAFKAQADSIREIIELKPEDRAEKLESLSDSVTEWLKQRDQRWSGLGSNLGTMLRKGMQSAIGI